MRRFTRSIAIIAGVLSLAPAAQAQRGGRGSDTTAGRGGGLPLTPSVPLKFTTDEVTWAELDVSPDGRTIVFDILGDIYTVPVEGGKATRLTSGQAYDSDPRFSPDGKSIVFISDRDK